MVDHVYNAPELARANAQSNAHENGLNLVAVADGFKDRALHADGTTAATGALGLAAGVGTAFARNNELFLGGLMGKFGRWAPLVVPAVLAEECIRRWDGNASTNENLKHVGEAAFDVLLPTAT